MQTQTTTTPSNKNQPTATAPKGLGKGTAKETAPVTKAATADTLSPVRVAYARLVKTAAERAGEIGVPASAIKKALDAGAKALRSADKGSVGDKIAKLKAKVAKFDKWIGEAEEKIAKLTKHEDGKSVNVDDAVKQIGEIEKGLLAL